MTLAEVLAARVQLYQMALTKGHHQMADEHYSRIVAITAKLPRSTTSDHKRLRNAFRRSAWDNHAHVNGDAEVISLNGHFLVQKLKETLTW